MCHRFIPLTLEQVEEALANLRNGRRATVSRRPPDAVDGPGSAGTGSGRAGAAVRDAYPGSRVPVIVPGEQSGRIDAGLQALMMTWGFDRPGRAAEGPGPTSGPASTARRPADKVIFNARLDTATRQLREGRGMWAEAIARGRCLIPVRAFYERASGTVPARTFRFSLAGSSLFLLAGIAQDGRFSLVTTAPNAQVAPVHDRMPLVLGPGESSAWLAGDFPRLADRSRVLFDVAEEPGGIRRRGGGEGCGRSEGRSEDEGNGGGPDG